MAEIKYRNIVASTDVDKLAGWLMKQDSPYTMLDESGEDWFVSEQWKF